MRFGSLLAIGAAALMATSSPVLAHAHLVRSTPAANVTVAAPERVTLTFNERLTPAFSKVEIVMVGHDMQVPVRTAFSSDGKTITATPQGRFMKGSYTIKWTAAGADGHRMQGEIPFKVQ